MLAWDLLWVLGSIPYGLLALMRYNTSHSPNSMLPCMPTKKPKAAPNYMYMAKAVCSLGLAPEFKVCLTTMKHMAMVMK